MFCMCRRLIFLFLLTSFNLFADSFIGDCIDINLEVVYSYYKDDWIMGLSDGSSWKLTPLKEKRKRTWTQWWYSDEPKEWQLSDDYVFDPYTWKGSYTIAVHEARDALSSSCQHILENQVTGQKVFAEYIPNGSHFVPRYEYAEQLISNSISSSTSISKTYPVLGNFLLLPDQSIWKVYLMENHEQSWSEWWNGIEVDQPDEMFVSNMDFWRSGDAIKIYHSQVDDSQLKQKYGVKKPNYEIVLIENKTRSKIAYAGSVSFQDFFDTFLLYSREEYSRGYSDGHDDGYSWGYDAGYTSGYAAGSR